METRTELAGSGVSRTVVRMVGRLALLLTLAGALALHGRPAASEDLPAVARPRLAGGDPASGSGTVFFLPATGGAGAVAVGAAHSFDLFALSRSDVQLELRLGKTDRVVATSSRYYVPPGRSFSEPGASVRDDYVVFALDAAPRGVRILEADPGKRAPPGTRVRILGVPATIAQDEDDLYGSVSDVTPERIDVILDVPADLRGWGGAPVLSYESGRVLGLLEAAWPDDGKLRLGVAPIGAVLDAMDTPLEGGRGAPFARYPRPEGSGGGSGSAPGAAGDPAPAATRSPTPPPQTLSRVQRRRPEGEPLLGRAGAVDARLEVVFEYPHDGSVLGDANGAFVAGRAVAQLGGFQRFDVVLVIDTSGSTAQMSGSDINGNGVVGEGGFRGIFGKSDAGDSILAAEIAAARQLLRGLDPRSTRVALVTFAGEPPRDRGLFSRGARTAALTEEALTTEYARIESGLDRVLSRGATGMTHMAAGVDQATVELLGLRGSVSQPDPESEKVVLFLTDGQPTLPYDAIFEADNVKAVLRASDRASRASIRIHSFALGPEALEGPIATVEMAERTGGYFTPVRHPGDIVEVIENVSFANIEELHITNATTGDEASQLVTHADGRWGALVPLAAGKNRIRATARSADGSVASADVVVQYAPGAPDPLLPPRLVTDRNRLLEQRLLELKRERITAEREKAERTRQELVLEIEREREEARERAARQRKELDLEAVQPPGEVR